MYDYVTHILLFLAAILFVEGLAVYAWRFRSIPGAKPYAVHKAAIAVMLLSLVMASQSAGLAAKLSWIRLHHTGTFIAVLAWLALTLQMTGRGKWLNRRTVAAMSVILALALAVLFSDRRYGLFWSRIWVEGNGVRAVDGLGSTIILFSGYLVLLASTGLFIHRFIKIGGILRAQAGILIFSTCVTVTGHFCWRFATTPELRQDSLALAFIVSGTLDAFAFFRWRLFDIIAVAQAVVTKTMGDGLVVLDKQGLIVGLNPAAERIVAKSGSEVSGNFAVKTFEPWPELIDLLRKPDARTGEVLLNRRSYAVLIAPLPGEGRENLGKALVFHDITAGKTAQESLIEQQRAVAVLKERDRLGRELHDGQGQLLGFFHMQLEAARSLIAKGRPDQAEPLLRKLAEITQGMNADIRESIAGLKIAAAEEGFLRTLDNYLRWFSQNYGIKTDLAIIGEFKEEMLSPAAEVQLQRIIQEALNNVRKHAGARQVRVIIQANETMAEFTVDDDGAGFDVAKAMAKRGSYGLHIMRERAAEIGGALSFDAAPNAGTRVKVRVPVKSLS